MRTRSGLALGCLTALALGAFPAGAADLSTTVLGLLAEEQNASFAEELSTHLRGAVEVRKELGHTGKDQTLEQVAMAFGCLETIDPMCLQEIGEGLETANLIYGKVTTEGESPKITFIVAVTLFDVPTGKVLKTATVEIPHDKQGSIYLQESSDRVIAELFGSTPATTIIVQSNVSGADILLDGESVGTTGSEPTWIREVDPGEHVLKVEKNGYDTFEESFDIEEGGRMDIDAPLYKQGEKPVVPDGGGGVTPVGGPKVDKNNGKYKMKLGVGAGLGVLGLGLVGAGIGMTASVSGANADLKDARQNTLSGKDVCACFDDDLPTSDCFGTPDWPAGVDPDAVRSACSSGKTSQALQFVFYGLGVVAAGVGIYLITDAIIKHKKGGGDGDKPKKVKKAKPEKAKKAKAVEEDEEQDEDAVDEQGADEEEDEEQEDEEETEESAAASIRVIPSFTPDGGFISVIGHF